MIKPRHRGLGEERTTFFLLRSFGKGARSNPGANSKSNFIEMIWKRHRTQARERPQRRAGGRFRNGLDLKLVKGVKKRLDSRDVN